MLSKTLVIGGSGFVGSHFLYLSRRCQDSFLAPSHQELDITQKKKVFDFFTQIKPEFVINFAAIVNVAESEKERGNKKEVTWRTNVIGVKNIAQACRETKAFFIQISSDAVFPGTKEFPGPYPEDAIPPKSNRDLSWYGYSKLKAEEEVKKLKKRFAVIRISCPFGNLKSEKDLVNKTIKDIKADYKIFTDQFFTPTFIPDLTSVIWKIQVNKATGIFHVACRGLIPRIELARHLAKKLKLKEKLKEGSMAEFMKEPSRPPMTRLGGLLTKKTRKALELKFHSWQEALNTL